MSSFTWSIRSPSSGYRKFTVGRDRLTLAYYAWISEGYDELETTLYSDAKDDAFPDQVPQQWEYLREKILEFGGTILPGLEWRVTTNDGTGFFRWDEAAQKWRN